MGSLTEIEQRSARGWWGRAWWGQSWWGQSWWGQGWWGQGWAVGLQLARLARFQLARLPPAGFEPAGAQVHLHPLVDSSRRHRRSTWLVTRLLGAPKRPSTRRPHPSRHRRPIASPFTLLRVVWLAPALSQVLRCSHLPQCASNKEGNTGAAELAEKEIRDFPATDHRWQPPTA